MSTKKSFPLDSIFIWNILMLGATLFLFIAPISATNYSKKQQLNWIPFIWVGDSISEKYIEKAFIYIPIQLENTLYQYTMQFDLGTPKSVFYERPIQFLKQTNSSFIQKWNPKSFSFQHLNMRMGNVTFSNTEIFYMKNMGDFINENDLKQGKPIHIGTIGADLFQNKVVIIDYKASKLAITDSVPSQYASLPSVKFTIDNGIIKLPFSINGQECPMMFDTGSSPFQLVTTKERALNIANPTIVDSLSGPLWWGKEITFYGLNVTKTIEFAGEKRPENSMVFYDKDGLWANIFNAFNIWGITGNAYFLENVVIIDYKNCSIRIQ